jgi:alkylated DNA repair protein (DNA oxidative demethylase)
MLIKDGLEYYQNALNNVMIQDIMQQLELIFKEAPLYHPTMPKTGNKFSVKMTNCGKFGWVSDKTGYRYQENHPFTNKKWPHIPNNLLKIWFKYTNISTEPDCCLINLYDKNAKMGLHQDNDEADFSYPVLSISIGASALFKIGGLKRQDKTHSLKLNNGDLIIMGGNSRLIYHGISKIYANEKYPERINLTFRKV